MAPSPATTDDDGLDPRALPVDLARPGLPPSVGERLAAVAGAQGLSRMAAGAVAIVVAGTLGWWLLRPPSPPVEASLPVETAVPGGAGAAGSPGAGPTTVPGSGAPAGPTSSTELSRLVVHVAGAVAHPGLVEVRSPARVDDAVEAAGGLAGAADVDRVNLAAPISDGERVYVPSRGQAEVPGVVEGGAAPSGPAGGAAAGGSGAAAGPVDLNSATAEELDALPGVGPATAAAIIGYRDEHGGFGSVDELDEVKGIGEAKLAELEPLVRV